MLATLRYLAFAVLAIGGPGIALSRLFGVAVDPALLRYFDAGAVKPLPAP